MKPTRGGVFGWSIIGLAAVLVLLFYIVFHGSRQTIMESSYRIRDEASREISERVASFLSKAPEAAQQFQLELNRGLVGAIYWRSSPRNSSCSCQIATSAR